MRRTLLVVVTFALAASAAPARAQICSPFTDVAENDPFCGYIQWMEGRGVTLGCHAQGQPPAYCPTNFVRRDQMAAFMNRLADVAVFQNGGNAFGGPATLGTKDNEALLLIVNDSRVMRYEPRPLSPNVIGGNPANGITGGLYGATIAGGGATTDPNFEDAAPNRVLDIYGTVGGGFGNVAGSNDSSPNDAAFATVGGGRGNLAQGAFSTVAGGDSNAASGRISSVSGGESNVASGPGSSVSGGNRNTASGGFSFVAGGNNNNASGGFSTVAGGFSNIASGHQSFAAGTQANAATDGSFVWSDSRAFGFSATAVNTFNVRSTGGISLVVAINGSTGAPTQFCNLSPGVVGWQCFSDRDSKENFEAAASGEILERLVAMPLSTWTVRGIDNAPRMLGPTAQDFHAAFDLGGERNAVSMLNLNGVALAAIQGLNAKLEARLAERDAELAELRREMAEMRQMLRPNVAGR